MAGCHTLESTGLIGEVSTCNFSRARVQLRTRVQNQGQQTARYTADFHEISRLGTV